MKQQPSSALDYFQRLIDFLYNPMFARHLRTVSAHFDRSLLPLDFNLMPFIVDTLLLETKVGPRTPLEHFLVEQHHQLTPAERNIYAGFKKSFLGAFRVVAAERPERIVMEDIATAQIFVVKDSQAIRFLTPNQLTISRLLPFQGHYVLTGSCSIINMSDSLQVLKLAKQLDIKGLQVPL